MIWILLGYLLFGTGGDASIQAAVDTMRSRALEAVDTAEDRERIEAATDAFGEFFGSAVEQFQAEEGRFLEVLRKKDGGRGELNASLQVAHEIRRGVQLQMLDLRDDLHAVLDREQWAEVFPAPEAGAGD